MHADTYYVPTTFTPGKLFDDVSCSITAQGTTGCPDQSLAHAPDRSHQESRRKLRPRPQVAVFAVALCAGMSPEAPQAEAQSSPDVAKALTSSQGTDTRAPEGGAKVVVFGDSHTAGTNAPLWADDRGCFRSNTAWPMQLQRKLGLAPGDLIDSSCWGSTINSGPNLHFSDQVRSASARGALGQRTEHIFIQLGFNDAWGTQVTMKDSVKHCLFDVAHGCGDEAVRAGAMQDPAAITGTNYADRVRQVVDYLKYYAPKAKITLVGYQEMVPPSGGELCTNVAGQQHARPMPRHWCRQSITLTAPSVRLLNS